MKKYLPLIMFTVSMLCSAGIQAEDVAVSGAKPGEWTMDLAAAATLAKEKGLPMLINFTGSDWCGWCKLMDKNVFSQEEWKKYAQENLVLCTVDFPKNKSIVPENYVKRNEEIKKRFGVKGFPTFVVLESDATTELGRLGAGKETTPASFISEMAPLFRYRTAEVAKYTSTMKSDAKAEYLAIAKNIQANSSSAVKGKEQIESIKKTIEQLEEQSVKLKEKARDFRAAQLGAEKMTEYKAIKAEFDKLTSEMTAWMESEPERTEENMKKIQSMAGTLRSLEQKLAQY